MAALVLLVCLMVPSIRRSSDPNVRSRCGRCWATARMPTAAASTVVAGRRRRRACRLRRAAHRARDNWLVPATHLRKTAAVSQIWTDASGRVANAQRLRVRVSVRWRLEPRAGRIDGDSVGVDRVSVVGLRSCDLAQSDLVRWSVL